MAPKEIRRRDISVGTPCEQRVGRPTLRPDELLSFNHIVIKLFILSNYVIIDLIQGGRNHVGARESGGARGPAALAGWRAAGRKLKSRGTRAALGALGARE